MGKVRLSQCMIVKNEEKNIRRALEWAKDIVIEQIVVDTGSTDRTVEIAKEMGAKVYHFEWIDDFSEAKNFAIEKAKGDWIAFLDADEYIRKTEVWKLINILEQVEKCIKRGEEIDLLRLPSYHLDDEDRIISSFRGDRIFRNKSYLRYHNRIHECLTNLNTRGVRAVFSKEIEIFHTGYSKEAYQSTKKLDRNIRMLLKEVEEEPEKDIWWYYLGDSYLGKKELKKAKEAFLKALNIWSDDMSKEMKINIISGLMRIHLMEYNTNKEELLEWYKKFLTLNEICPDIEYWVGSYFYLMGNFKKAIKYLEMSVNSLEGGDRNDFSQYTVYMIGNLKGVYQIMMECYLRLQNKQQAVRYAMLSLKIDKYYEDVLEKLIKIFFENKENADAVYNLLSKLYNFDSMKDRLIVIKSAKKAGFIALKDRVLFEFSEEERTWFEKNTVLDKKQKRIEELKRKYKQIQCNNYTDIAFLEAMDKVKENSKEELVENLIGCLMLWKNTAIHIYEKYTNYLTTYPFWGKLDAEEKQFDSFHERIGVLKKYWDDCIWFYNQLQDYRSKRILIAVLENWINLDISTLNQVIDQTPEYFNPDLILTNKDEVFVDVGGYIGDTVLNFINFYGTDYKKIYSYEITKHSAQLIKENTRYYPNIIVRQVGVGEEKGEMYMKVGGDLSANQLSNEGEEKVEIVTLDEDIQEPITFLKMDIEGAEQKALLGAKRHIVEEKPKLAIAIYHGFEALFEIPKMIHEMRDDYKFYLEYHGGNLTPTEITLIAL